MAYNWKPLTLSTYPTAKYVDLSGTTLALGADGTPDNPFNNIPEAITAAGSFGYVVVGQGTYTGSINAGFTYIVGELGKTQYTILNIGGGSCVLYDFCANLTIKGDGVTGTWYVAGGNGVQSTRQDIRVIDMIIQNAPLGSSYELYIPIYLRCEFINTILYQGGYAKPKFHYCKFINTEVYSNSSGLYGCYGLLNTDIDQYSKIQLGGDNSIGGLATQFKNNNIRGLLMFTEPGSSDVNTYINLAAAKVSVDHIGFFDNSSFSADPLYNNVSLLSLGVNPSSPNLNAGQGGTNIGNVFRSVGLYNNITPSMTLAGGATITNLDGTNDLTVTPTEPFGEHITGSIVINSLFVEEVGRIDYIGLIATDSTLGGIGNQQVPDILDHTIGMAGNRPEMLSYKLRFSTNIDGVWDNAGYIPTNDWFIFAFGEQPTLDSNFVGNGEDGHNQLDPAKFVIGAKYIQIWTKIIKENWNTI